MHASVKAFMEMDFTSYLLLGELDIKGIHQLCSDANIQDNHLEGSSSRTGPSSNTPGK